MPEKTLILGAEKNLVATLTTADTTPGVTQGWVALLTNAGVIPRSGPHRMNVRLARRFAAMGIASVRFDLSGLGDSGRSSGTLPVIDQWVADTRAVMDQARTTLGAERFFMVGFCSGAEVAHHVAMEDPRMRAAVLWDLYTYPTAGSRVRALWYRWKRAKKGHLLQKLGARLRSAAQRSGERENELVPAPEAPPKAEFAGQVQTLVNRGVEVLFAFSGGQPERYSHPSQFQKMFAGHAFADKVAHRFLEVSDHVVTRTEAQLAFSDMVVDWLQTRVIRPPPPGT